MVELDPSSVVPLRASWRVNVDVDHAQEVLQASDLGWLGVASDDEREGGRRRLRTDLRLPVRAVGHEITFHKAAMVDIGPLRRANGDLHVDISWRSANLAPLFPVFSGRLTVRSDRLILDGLYAPPGGRLGVALDHVLLGIAARRTAQWFLGLVAGALRSYEADRTAPAGELRSSPTFG